MEGCTTLAGGANAEEHLDMGGDGLFELEFMWYGCQIYKWLPPPLPPTPPPRGRRRRHVFVTFPSTST